MVPEQRNPETVETKEEESEEEPSGSSSEREEGAIWETWPNRRPSTSPRAMQNRSIIEARVGPDICIFCSGRPSIFNCRL